MDYKSNLSGKNDSFNENNDMVSSNNMDYSYHKQTAGSFTPRNSKGMADSAMNQTAAFPSQQFKGLRHSKKSEFI